MLARAKRGMVFSRPESNTWNLQRSNAVTGDSKLEKEAKTAKDLLTGVIENHPGTPWAVLAQRELDTPMGWEWQESFTDLTPQNNNNGGNNNNMNIPENERARMLAPPLPKRPAKKI